MAKDMVRTGNEPEPMHMRASDADRHKIADRLKAALDEGRLALHEYDDRVRDVWAAQTYADLTAVVSDLPQPGLSAEDVAARRVAERRRAARRMPTALIVLWTIWAALAALNVVVYVLVEATTDADVHPWPVWLAVPGAALLVVTLGVQTIRLRDHQ